ncbi:DNA polymerase III subunit gamma/tau [Kaustia mangrovi]|uniref:DNA polymerase III subunit gamma/tau n=1 Tax=Kaustia mangrovi TaxID=2593653 RepID=A0A7S8C612_9HYPH|nr:DNA polymerase III subunit gamma/tau [Kaustia mangrovi]QPC43849.1 DNA polymerase III subunit gamma/tau [Kaustia mangrovi]
MSETDNTPAEGQGATANPSPDGADATGGEASGYRVLARKYRPRTFEDLIGQDAMVRTLANAFRAGRIAQAYMLTGVRGVGKTTTARLIARALNYTGGDDRPSVEMDGFGEHCEAILESRHPDVIEMDAASRTGVEDIRELIEGVRYRPIAARYKVYIIDEVHMLSKAAFNALLKTLEEPPEHVKFIFATTEIRKVPVTVLSRCQRFDLRRLDAELLIAHFRKVSAAENVEADDEALKLIARAAEGSVRDGLSLLDQAIAYGGAHIEAAAVRDMLGLADRGRIVDLFEAVLRGEAADALGHLKALYDYGADPASVLADMAELTHWITRLKVVPGAADDVTRTEVERTRGVAIAGEINMPALTRAWQMLLKGLGEVNYASNPMAAAEMVLIRMAYAAELPTPDEIIRRMGDGPGAAAGTGAPQGTGGGQVAAMARPAPAAPAQAAPQDGPTAHAGGPAPAAAAATAPEAGETAAPASARTRFATFAEIVSYVGRKRDIRLKTALERHVRPVRVAPGTIEIALEPDAPQGLSNELARKLEQWTGERWGVAISNEPGEKPLAEQERDRRDSLFREARESTVVQAVLGRFPGAEIVDVREFGGLEPPDDDPDAGELDDGTEGPDEE